MPRPRRPVAQSELRESGRPCVGELGDRPMDPVRETSRERRISCDEIVWGLGTADLTDMCMSRTAAHADAATPLTARDTESDAY